MLIPNDYLMLCLAKQIIQERLSEVETYRLLRTCKQKPLNQFTRYICLLLSCLGLLMLNWGERLQRYSYAVGEREARS
jgi:hypothetical protein